MRIRYTFILDGIVGREECDVPSDAVLVIAYLNRDLRDKAHQAYTSGDFAWCFPSVLDYQRIPVAGWESPRLCPRTRRLSDDVACVAKAFRAAREPWECELGAWEWVAYGRREQRGCADTLEAAQLAAEDAIREMCVAGLSSIGEGA